MAYVMNRKKVEYYKYLTTHGSVKLFCVMLSVLTHFEELARRERQYWPLNQELVFLLLDDPKQAYNCMVQMPTPTKNILWQTLQGLLLNGHEKGIFLWDLKVLSALCVCIGSFANTFQIETSGIEVEIKELSLFSEHICRTFLPNHTLLETIEGNKVNDLARWCIEVKNEETRFFCPFRLRLFKIFTRNTSLAVEIIKSLNLKFYGTALDDGLEKKLREKSISPLLMILQFIAEGHLSDTGEEKDLDKLIEEHISERNNKICMKKDTFQITDDGVYVTRGECLIINQTYENDPKNRRQGTEKDEIDLIQTWQKLGCKDSIMVKRDLTIYEITEALKEFRSKVESSLPDFIVVVVLSHGRRDLETGIEFVMDINMKGFPIEKIENMFINGQKCPSMIGRPKLFFIQACRGRQEQIPQDAWLR